VNPDRTAQITSLLGQLAGLLAEPAEREVPARSNGQNPPPRVLLTVEEAAQQLGIGKTKAYAFVSSGELESVRIGRLRRIHVDAIATFAARLVAEQNTNRPPAA
jgi:excisionase family DNA binding protein